MSEELKVKVDENDDHDKSGNPHKIFVGNIPFNFKAEDLASLFRPFGDVLGAKVFIASMYVLIAIVICDQFYGYESMLIAVLI
jgi:RNA recognition motif-containing protein